jgi:DNA-directed RNA polymerase subunit RPC12/RpoP
MSKEKIKRNVYLCSNCGAQVHKKPLKRIKNWLTAKLEEFGSLGTFRCPNRCPMRVDTVERDSGRMHGRSPVFVPHNRVRAVPIIRKVVEA